MTSTEFTVGLNGSRISSKVLKPPGGGSSDIFGLGISQFSAPNEVNERLKNGHDSCDTQNRLFGISNDVKTTPGRRNQMQCTRFENESKVPPRVAKKHVIRRNPITGEEIKFNTENYQKTESNEGECDDKKEVENCQKPENSGKEENDNAKEIEEKVTEAVTKPIQTSIRIKNPPGGKSSGIF